MAAEIERDTVTLARRIAELGAGTRARVFNTSWWSDRVMDWAMERPAFKTQLFRFVDVFPALTGAPEVARHLAEYFEGAEAPKAFDLGLDLADRVPLGARVEARIARRNILRMARQFIVGASPGEAVAGLHQLWRAGSAFTVDGLGEKNVVADEAGPYSARVHELVVALDDASRHWAPDDHLERDDLGRLGRVNVSVKPTALATHYDPLARDVGLPSAKARMRSILRLARERGAFVNVDMEHYDAKDLTLQLFRDLLSEDEFADMPAGIVVQAYLRDSRDDLAELIAWSARRAQPITVRLVKGAYWDAETVHARAECWPVPVFEDKDATDANYERCVRLLHDHHGEIRAAFGSHNLRSLAYAITYARHKGIPDTGYEIQMLYGMAEPMHEAMRRLGLRLRVYAPVGELVPGMAYLVRRLLENTSNESFVRHRFAEGRDLDELLAPPGPGELPAATQQAPRSATDPADPALYLPEPVSEWRRASARDEMARAVTAVRGRDRRARCGRRRGRPRRAGPDRRRPCDHGGHARVGRSGGPRRRGRRRGVVWRRRGRRCGRRGGAGARRMAPHAGAGAGGGVVPRRRLDAPAPQRHRCARVLRGWQALGPGRRRRVRGHRLLRVLRPRDPAPRRRRRRPGAVASGRNQPARLPGQRRDRGDRAVELSAGDPDRHDGGRAGRRQPRHPQARRADAPGRVAPHRGAVGGRRAAGRRPVPAGARRGGRRPAGRAPRCRRHRVHRLAGGRVGPPPAGPGDPPRPAAREGGPRRDGRQERPHHRRGCRPRRGRARCRGVGVRLRGAEMLGRQSADRRRRHLRRRRRAPGGSGRRGGGRAPPAARGASGPPDRRGGAQAGAGLGRRGAAAGSRVGPAARSARRRLLRRPRGRRGRRPRRPD